MPVQPPVQPVTAGPPGYGFVRLNQLAVEHLMGAR